LNFLRASLPSTIEIQQDIRRGTKPILANSTRVHQVLMNLCANAGHAMRERGGLLKVVLDEVELGGNSRWSGPPLVPGCYIRMTVSDTGCGIHPAVVERVFEPYFTTKKAGEGTGLGLAIAAGIIKSYGGAITVKSQLGRGSTFQVYIPTIEAEAPKMGIATKTLSTGCECVLFVDDEPCIAEIGGKMLAGLGYRVSNPSNSMEALEVFLARRHDFDLVITDMTMPGMTGSELIREIRKVRSDIPVVVCTGYSDLLEEDAAEDLGIDAILMKPVLRRELAETVRSVLDAGKKRK